MFRVSSQIKHKDLDLYKELKNSFKDNKRNKSKDKKKVRLGGTPENLMKQNSYKRIGRRVRQTKWS